MFPEEEAHYVAIAMIQISENNYKMTSRFLPSPRFINKQSTQRVQLHTTNGFYKMLFIGTCNFRTLFFDLKKNCIACLFKNRKVKIPFISSVPFKKELHCIWYLKIGIQKYHSFSAYQIQSQQLPSKQDYEVIMRTTNMKALHSSIRGIPTRVRKYSRQLRCGWVRNATWNSESVL